MKTPTKGLRPGQRIGQPHDPSNRGIVVAYHRNTTNHCPHCNRTAWFVGRLTATCAHERCGMVLPIEHANLGGSTRVLKRDGKIDRDYNEETQPLAA